MGHTACQSSCFVPDTSTQCWGSWRLWRLGKRGASGEEASMSCITSASMGFIISLQGHRNVPKYPTPCLVCWSLERFVAVAQTLPMVHIQTGASPPGKILAKWHFGRGHLVCVQEEQLPTVQPICTHSIRSNNCFGGGNTDDHCWWRLAFTTGISRIDHRWLTLDMIRP